MSTTNTNSASKASKFSLLAAAAAFTGLLVATYQVGLKQGQEEADELSKDYYTVGYKAGAEAAWANKKADAKSCYQWWFGDNKAQFVYELRQFCKSPVVAGKDSKSSKGETK
jgi:hypothetical protein